MLRLTRVTHELKCAPVSLRAAWAGCATLGSWAGTRVNDSRCHGLRVLQRGALMANSADLILWIYIALLTAGGLVGFLKANSKMSLLMSLAFAIPLAMSIVLSWPSLVSLVLIGFLCVFFGMRFAKSRKLMPAGVMAMLSLVTLALQGLTSQAAALPQ